MATDVERLVIRLEASMKGYERELAKQRGNTDKELKNIESRFSKAEGVIGSFGKGLIGGALSAISFNAIAKGAEAAASAIARIGEQAETVGVSTDFLQALQFAGLESGIKGLDTALEQFVARSDEVTRAEGALYDKLNALNPAIARQIVLAGDQEQRFKLVAEAIRQASSAEEKAGIARAAFGKSGVEMVRILKDGSAGVEEFGKRAQELGIILDKDLIKRVDELGDRLDAAKKIAGVEFQRALVDLLPVLIAAANGLAAMARAGNAVLDVFREIGNRSTANLKSQLEDLKAAQAAFDAGAENKFGIDRAKLGQSIADIENEIARRERPQLTVRPRGSERASTKSSTESKDAFERAQDTIEKRRALLEAETASIDLNSAARERARVVAELETAAKKANAEAGKANTEVTAEQRIKIDEIAAAYERVALASEKANSPMARFAREAKDVNKSLEEAAVGGLRGAEDAFVGIVTGSESAADAVKRMADAIIADLIRIAFRAAITGPLVRAIGGGFGGGGVDVGSATGFDIGSNAAGTDNWRGGPTWVGERGPEIVNLPSGAQVIPNNVARGMGGGITNNISVVNNAGADVKQQTSRNASRGQDMRVVIDPIIAQNVSTPGSASDRALRSRGQLVRR